MRETRIRGPVAPAFDSHAPAPSYMSMTKLELRKECDEAGLELRVKATKGEMIEALEAA